MSVIPCFLSSRIMCSITGLPHSETSGLGVSPVTGFKRLPSPPAMMIAFINIALPWIIVAVGRTYIQRNLLTLAEKCIIIHKLNI